MLLRSMATFPKMKNFYLFFFFFFKKRKFWPRFFFFPFSGAKNSRGKKVPPPISFPPERAKYLFSMGAKRENLKGIFCKNLEFWTIPCKSGFRIQRTDKLLLRVRLKSLSKRWRATTGRPPKPDGVSANQPRSNWSSICALGSCPLSGIARKSSGFF